jgi:outer membrane protein TolC
LARFEPDWDSAYEESINLRPELALARKEVKVRQLELINQRNNLLPDLRFTSTYDVNAIGTGLDGPNTDNALRNMASNHFNNWSTGLRLNVPIGFRVANANVRIAKLELARAYEILHDQELRVGRSLSQSYRRMFTSYEQIKVQRAQREAFGAALGEQRFGGRDQRRHSRWQTEPRFGLRQRRSGRCRYECRHDRQ